MITILAHLVFWPSVIWNLVLWYVIVTGTGNYKFRGSYEDVKALVVGFLLLMVPGVYLFGWY